MSDTKDLPLAMVNTAQGESEHHDAAPAEYLDDRSFWQICRQNPAIIGYTLCANFGPLLFGYDGLALGVIIALPAFSFDFAEPFEGGLLIPALWQGLWTAGNQVGVMVGAALNGHLQDKFGRRPMLFVGWAIATLSVALGYTSYMPDSYAGRRTLLLMAKIVVGVGMGILMSTCQTYVSEIAPVKIRGMLLGIYTFVLVSSHHQNQEKSGLCLDAPANIILSWTRSSSARPSPSVSSSPASPLWTEARTSSR